MDRRIGNFLDKVPNVFSQGANMKFSKCFLIIFSLILLVCCSTGKEKIKIAGSTTVLPIVQAAAEEYMNTHPEIDISVRGGGSSIGILSAINKIIDIGNASRKVSKTELEIIREKAHDLIESEIALDAISIVVHPENPITELSQQQIRDIYSGRTNNWRDLGGSDLEIVVISRDTPSGSFVVFNETVLDEKKVTSKALMLASNNAVATNISFTPGAIGYVGIGYVNDYIKPLRVNGVIPSSESAKNREYILTRKLYMYTTDTSKELAQEFIDFILSERGQQIVEEQGYIRIN